MRDAVAENEDARLKEAFDTLQNISNCLTEYDDTLDCMVQYTIIVFILSL